MRLFWANMLRNNAIDQWKPRVNSIHPRGVATALATEDARLVEMLTAHPNYGMSFASALPGRPLAESDDISDAVVYLASELSRAVTGTQLTVDMGATTV